MLLATGRILLLLAITLAVAGCASQVPPLASWAEQSIGRPIAEIEAIEARPESYAARSGKHLAGYRLSNGNRVHVHPDRPACAVHFEVNPRGIVVAYRLVGAGCAGQ